MAWSSDLLVWHSVGLYTSNSYLYTSVLSQFGMQFTFENYKTLIAASTLGVLSKILIVFLSVRNSEQEINL